jgi:hypothetical protein
VSNRILALAGPLFGILFAIGAALEGSAPGEKASGAQVVTFFHDHRGKTLVGVFASPLLVALLLVFFAHLRSVARAVGTGSAGPTVAVAGAAVLSAGALVGSMINLALVSAADNHKTSVAETLGVLYNVDWLPFIGGIAVTLIGAGMTVVRAPVVPRWLGWIALAVGIVSLAGPGGFLGFFVLPLWMLVAGLFLFVREPAGVATAVE